MHSSEGLKRQTHLEFYQQHGISPVSYDIKNLSDHFERRASLYDQLALPTLAFSKSRVLEIAAGTGHNSLYIAAQHPESLVLLEPNSVGIDEIKSTYSQFGADFIDPILITKKLEDYFPDRPYEIVICENWLGTSKHEQLLLNKLKSFICPRGILVITTVSPIGFLPNLIRRYLSSLVAPLELSFEERSRILTNTFQSHLHTLKAMTRNVEDWVHDNMINPAYFDLCLSTPTALDFLGVEFEILGSSPSISEDWRWFKSLYGENKNNNIHYLKEYWKKNHNFLDSRLEPSSGNAELNIRIEKKAFQFLEAVRAHEDCLIQGKNAEKLRSHVVLVLQEFIGLLPESVFMAKIALEDALNLIQNNDQINTEDISDSLAFAHLFGRETSYISVQKI
jgi:2-polyprenyl-3-methyl-5-hydroxy-6-metoxy-1,4-benzoquinol methylase